MGIIPQRPSGGCDPVMTQSKQKNTLLEEEIRKLKRQLRNCERKRKDLKLELKEQSKQIGYADNDLKDLRNDREYFINNPQGTYHLEDCKYYQQYKHSGNWDEMSFSRAEVESWGFHPCNKCIYPRGYNREIINP